MHIFYRSALIRHVLCTNINHSVDIYVINTAENDAYFSL
jgi:hypothetical protein